LGIASHVDGIVRTYGDTVAIVVIAASEKHGIENGAARGIELSDERVHVPPGARRGDACNHGKTCCGALASDDYVTFCVHGDVMSPVEHQAAEEGTVKQVVRMGRCGENGGVTSINGGKLLPSLAWRDHGTRCGRASWQKQGQGKDHRDGCHGRSCSPVHGALRSVRFRAPLPVWPLVMPYGSSGHLSAYNNAAMAKSTESHICRVIFVTGAL
jgi:hypothetical protein